MKVTQTSKYQKGKRYERLKRTRIWPSVAMFAFFLLISGVMVSGFLEGFSSFVIGNKINLLTEQTNQVGIRIAQRIADGKSVEEAVADIQHIDDEKLPEPKAETTPDPKAAAQEDFKTAPKRLFNRLEETVDRSVSATSDVYVTDMDGNMVASTGDKAPDINNFYTIDLGDEFQIYEDEGFDIEDGEALVDSLRLTVQDVIRWSFFNTGKDSDSEQNWMQEKVMDKTFWMLADTNTDLDQSYCIFVQGRLQLQRSDLVYMLTGGLIIMGLLFVLLCVLLANTISAALTQRRITRILYTDPLTGGYNWAYFRLNAARRLRKRGNSKKAYALVKLRMDRFQNYCACYGVDDGEAFLERIERFLKARIGMTDLFARYSEADYGILLTCDGLTVDNYEAVLDRRIRTLMAELTSLNPDKKIHFHAGVCFIPPQEHDAGKKWFELVFNNRDDLDIDQMYNYASSALEQTHCGDDHRVGFFDEGLLEDQTWEHFVEAHMEEALDNEEFEVYVQPKYNPIDHKMVGAEALVRWNQPQKGMISPAKFIPIFEENGFITRLDDYMISHVAKLQAQWTIQKIKQVPVSVNVSRAHFSQEGLAEHICQLVDAYGPKHELIELEVTESAFFDEKEILIRTVKELKAYGFPVSMDDFGAGYSSLNSLKDIPLDVLKLDGEFFRGDDEDGRGAVVVEEAIRLARGLHMRVVAEGIERKDQVDFLAKQGCDMIQGFYFAKPMPVSEFEKQVEQDA